MPHDWLVAACLISASLGESDLRRAALRPPTRPTHRDPRAAVTETRVEGPWVRLTLRHETGPMTLYLKPWERRLRRIVIEPVLKMSAQELCRAISS